MITKVDESDPAVISVPMYPTVEHNVFTISALFEFATGRSPFESFHESGIYHLERQLVHPSTCMCTFSGRLNIRAIT